jgi:predicted nucleic acid-binding protein
VLVIDTGVLLAAADDTDRDHTACADLVETTTERLVTSPLVVAEAGYLIERQLGPEAEAGFYRSIGNGELSVEALIASDYLRMAALIERYSDLPLGGADASLVAIAERLGATRVATLDHRRFRIVRPLHVGAFEILP